MAWPEERSTMTAAGQRTESERRRIVTLKQDRVANASLGGVGRLPPAGLPPRIVDHGIDDLRGGS
jgi:hypothetical protein